MKLTSILKIFILINLCITLPLKAQNETFEWAKKITGSAGGYIDDLCTDSAGNIYNIGTFWHIVDFDPDTSEYILSSVYNSDIFVQKLSPNGDLIWVKTFGGVSSHSAHSIEIDHNGDLYVGGKFQDTINVGGYSLQSNGSYDALIAKMNTDGDVLWAKNIGGVQSDEIRDISIDDNSNIYYLGKFRDIVDFDPGLGIAQLTSYGFYDMFVLKLDSNGNFNWVKQIGGTSNDYCQSIKVDNNGAIYATGSFLGTIDFDPSINTHLVTSTGLQDAFILKLDSNGGFLWVSHLSGEEIIRGITITIDSNNNVYYAGEFYETAYLNTNDSNFTITSNGSADVFIQKLNTDGDVIWMNSLGGINHESINSMTFNSKNQLLASGSFYSEIDFDINTNNTINLTSNGSSDVYILKLDTNGGTFWAKTFGGEEGDNGGHITTDINDNIITVGRFRETVDFDPGLAVHNLSAFGVDMFIHKLVNCEVNIIDTIVSCSPYTWRDGNTYETTSYANHHVYSNDFCDTAYTLHLEVPVISTTLSTAGIIVTTNETSGDSYQWLDCNDDYTPIINETDQSIFGEPGGSYAIEIVKNGCIDTSYCVTLANFSIEDETFKNQIEIYPNPTTGKFSIKMNNTFDFLNVRVTSLLGREIINTSYNHTDVISLEINEPSGVYIIKISDELNQQATFKLLKY